MQGKTAVGMHIAKASTLGAALLRQIKAHHKHCIDAHAPVTALSLPDGPPSGLASEAAGLSPFSRDLDPCRATHLHSDRAVQQTDRAASQFDPWAS